MDEILIYDAIKFQRVVAARAKFVRFMRSQFESFSLTVKPRREMTEGRRTREQAAAGRRQGERGESRARGWEEEAGARTGGKYGTAGNIVLNRKIGILINTRGLSIKGREGNAKGWSGKKRRVGDSGTMTRSVRFILRASSTLALMSSTSRTLRRTRTGTLAVGIDYIVMKILTFDALQLMTPFFRRFIEYLAYRCILRVSTLSVQQRKWILSLI